MAGRRTSAVTADVTWPVPLRLSVLLMLSAPASMAQTAPIQGPGVQSARDAREPQVLATCKHPAAPSTFKLPPGFKPPSGESREYSVSAIPGVVAAGARWKSLWSVDGNNADGIVTAADGGLLIAQNSNSAVIELDKNGKERVLFKDTNTGGALSMSKSGALFIVQRGLYPSIWQLLPQRKLLTDRYQENTLRGRGNGQVTRASRGDPGHSHSRGRISGSREVIKEMHTMVRILAGCIPVDCVSHSEKRPRPL